MLGAGVAMASNDAGVAVRGGFFGLETAGAASADRVPLSGERWGLGAEFRPSDGLIVPPPAAEAVPATAGEAAPVQQPAGPDPAENAAAAEQIGPEVPPKPSILRSIVSDWKGELKFGFELGSGNNDRTRFRGGFDINKKYWGHTSRLFTEYILANNNSGESENRLVSWFRQDWATGGTKWNSVFLRIDGDADRFQDYDYRMTVQTGPSYQLIKNDKTNARLGLAASVRREFGGPNDDYVPEGALLFNGEHRLSDTQKIGLAVQYRPEIEQPRRYRVDARANWDIDINPEAGLGLRVTAQNRYNGRPSRRPERNDFDMSIDLFWRF